MRRKDRVEDKARGPQEDKAQDRPAESAKPVSDEQQRDALRELDRKAGIEKK